jgi:hypothetical protein
VTPKSSGSSDWVPGRGEAYDVGVVRWNVMADPEDNKLCISARGSTSAG